MPAYMAIEQQYTTAKSNTWRKMHVHITPPCAPPREAELHSNSPPAKHQCNRPASKSDGPLGPKTLHVKYEKMHDAVPANTELPHAHTQTSTTHTNTCGLKCFAS